MKCYQFCKTQIALFIGVAVFYLPSLQASAVEEEGNKHPWNTSVSMGMVGYEGDEEVRDDFITSLHLGYDYSERWTFEGVLSVAPDLDEDFHGETYEYAPGQWQKREVSNVKSFANRGFGDTYTLGLAVDGLFHFTRWGRLDPFLSVGAGVTWYADTFDNEFDPSVRVGGGLIYHLNDEWAIRADGRGFFAGTDTEANMTLSAGIMRTLGVHIRPAHEVAVAGGVIDSDGDGLFDDKESKIGTEPYDPDTDKDGLTDGEEINTYKTDPLNPDTDWDGLMDGPEVHKHKTNPLVRDTDKGNVADGHEVIEDKTNPLDRADDLKLYELSVRFDPDKWEIKPEYFPELNVIGKVLKQDPGATARIEGHVDKRKESSARHSKRLSQKRAKAIFNYLAGIPNIDRDRMEAVGYGFSRPKAPNDPVSGNPQNCRIEIYIRLSDHVSRAGEEAKSDKVKPQDK